MVTKRSGASVLPAAGAWLNADELPTFFETTTIGLPNGERLTATLPTQRLQHYGKTGQFINGWFAEAQGGNFGICLGIDNTIVVCTGRGGILLTYDLSGAQASAPRHYNKVGNVPVILQPSDFSDESVSLQPGIAVSTPNASWLTFVLVPLWHPFVAWALIAMGLFGLHYTKSNVVLRNKH